MIVCVYEEKLLMINAVPLPTWFAGGKVVTYAPVDPTVMSMIEVHRLLLGAVSSGHDSVRLPVRVMGL